MHRAKDLDIFSRFRIFSFSVPPVCLSRKTLAASCALLLLAGCQASPPAVLQPLPPLPAGEEGAAGPRTNGDLGVRSPPPLAAVVSQAAPATPHSSVVAGPANDGGSVTLEFADTDIRAVIQQILGQILKVDFTIDPAVHGTVTFKAAQPMTHAAALTTLEALLAQNGAVLVQSADFYRVLPASAGPSVPALGGPASTGAQIIALHHTNAADLIKVLAPVVGQGAAAAPGSGAPGPSSSSSSTIRMSVDPAHNAILITGDSAARATVESLIKSFDIDALAGRSYALFPVPSPEEPRRVAAQLREVFQTEGDGSLANLVRVVPMDAADAVLVVASDPHFIEDARRLFLLMDQARETTARTWHVYYVQNGESADLANVLQQAFTPANVTEHGSAAAKGNASVAPGQGFAQMTSSGSSSSGSGGISGTSGTGGSSGSSTLASGSGGASSGSASSPSSSAATQSLSAGSGMSGDSGTTTEDRARIIANHTNNALLIYSTPEEQSTIEAMLRKIDILPLQVRIDAAIAEVTLTDTLKYGTQFYLKHGGVNGLLSTAAGATDANLAGSFPGFVLSGKVGNAEMVLSALSDVTKVRILSSPQVMVLDNQPARLLVGNLVPYLSQTSQSTLTSSSSVVSNIEYRETGIILDVVPRVNKGGLVTLELSQEVSQVQTTTSSGIDSPTFTDRSVRSRVVVQDGQTVGLAGLISDNDSEENEGIPLLKDIPVLGNLFSSQTNSRTRTELVVLITPHVIEDQRAARALTESMRQSLLDASLVPQQLDALPASGSSNPLSDVIGQKGEVK
jgi:general secretion pathway protein D